MMEKRDEKTGKCTMKGKLFEENVTLNACLTPPLSAMFSPSVFLPFILIKKGKKEGKFPDFT